MTLFFQYILSVLVLFPFIVPIVYLIIKRKMGYAPSTLIGRAADITTPFLYIAVYVIARTIVGDKVLFYMIGITAIIALLFIILERVKQREYQIKRVLQHILRLLFLLLATTYMLLLIIGLIIQIVQTLH